MSDFAEINRMTMYEYRIRVGAYRRQRVDKEHDMHLQAWLNLTAQATKKSGKKIIPIYKTFKDFYNYEKALSKNGNLVSDADRPGVIDLLKKQQERREQGGKL